MPCMKQLNRFAMKYIILLFAVVLLYPINSSAQETYNKSSFSQIQNAYADSKLNVFPNPVTQNSFQVTSENEIETITTINMLGQGALVEISKIGPSHFTVIFKKKVPGIYLVTITYADKSKEVKRLIVK